MVRVKLPEFAVDDIEVFVREVVCDSVNVSLHLERGEDLEKVTSSQLTGCYFPIPILIHNIEDSPYDLHNISNNANTQ